MKFKKVFASFASLLIALDCIINVSAAPSNFVPISRGLSSILPQFEIVPNPHIVRNQPPFLSDLGPFGLTKSIEDHELVASEPTFDADHDEYDDEDDDDDYDGNYVEALGGGENEDNVNAGPLASTAPDSNQIEVDDHLEACPIGSKRIDVSVPSIKRDLEEMSASMRKQIEAGDDEFLDNLSKEIKLNEIIESKTQNPIGYSNPDRSDGLKNIESVIGDVAKRSERLLQRRISTDAILYKQFTLAKSLQIPQLTTIRGNETKSVSEMKKVYEQLKIISLFKESLNNEKIVPLGRKMLKTSTDVCLPTISISIGLLEKLEKFPNMGKQTSRFLPILHLIQRSAEYLKDAEQSLVSNASVSDVAFLLASKSFKWLAVRMVTNFLKRKFSGDNSSTEALGIKEEISIRLFQWIANKLKERYLSNKQ